MTDTTIPTTPPIQLDQTEWKLFINGEWVDSASGAQFETYNPATNGVLAHVAKAGREDVDRAVAAARSAFEGGKWPRTSAARRTTLLMKLAQIMRDRSDLLARAEVLDNAKAPSQAQAEL